MNGTAIISELRKQYISRKLIFYGLLFLAITLFLGAVYIRWKPEDNLGFFIVLIWLISAFILIREILKTRRVSANAITQYLNRVRPELQESCHLLLRPPDNLNLLERLQVQRLAPLLATLDTRQVVPVSYKKAWFTLFISLLLSAAVFALPNSEQAVITKESLAALSEKQTQAIHKVLPQIQAIIIRVTPPRYTRRSTYTVDNPNFKAEEGARLTWEVRTAGEINSLHLSVAEKQNLLFRKAKDKQDTYLLSLTPTGSFIYTLHLNEKKSDFYAVELLKDQNPVITIQKPKPYTEVQFGNPQQVTIEATLADDYGLQKANLVATVAQGSGESVKFREVQYPLNLNQTKKSENYAVRKKLDLKVLDMTYGDELYFYLQAWDNHRGYARSETYFVQLEDTTVVTDGADMSLGVSVVPAYFRSQRQLIIDTEKLIQEKKILTAATFQERSNNLGAEQKLLRLRYGKFLGEESETEIGGNPAEAEHHEDDGHNHGAATKDQNSASKLLDPYVHKHDTEEDATYFEPVVKAQLRAALAHMWEAELQLRLSKPEVALPFEYKALRLLKDVQQKSRAYVRKMGFNPPPLNESEKRLTGELIKISASANVNKQEEKLRYPFIRQALSWLVMQKSGRATSGQNVRLLQQAGQELAQIAIDQPAKYLKSLQNLRKLITEAQAGKITCSSCLVSVTAVFESVLPQPMASPNTRSAYRYPLAEQYFRNLK